MGNNEKKIEKIFSKYDGYIEEKTDLYGDKEPSFLFPFLANTFSYLMNDSDVSVTKAGVKVRKALHGIVKTVGPSFLPCKQVFENRHILEDSSSEKKDLGIVLPKEPVIWAPNHGFRGDPLASLMTASRHAHMLVGNIAQFYNTLEGLPIFANGVILVDRRNKTSRRAVLSKSEKVIDSGSDIIIFPEGTINKTPNQLALRLFPGVYKIAKEKSIKIVPIIHYKENTFSDSKKDIIHTVVDDPIDVSNMTQNEALTTLRDTYAYWKYLMMERYGQSTREKELDGAVDVDDFWENKLMNRPVGRYDIKTEKVATYCSQGEKEYYKALDDIINLETTPQNVLVVEDAKKLVKSQFQRRI